MSYLFYFICCLYLFSLRSYDCLDLRDAKLIHEPTNLTDSQLNELVQLTDVKHINKILDHILITRVVGTEGHSYVKDYIIEELEKLDWNVERDIFEQNTPVFGKLQFENIVARLNPHAERYLVLACHYDSKYTPNEVFLGATDSAVPCAMMLNIVTVLKPLLDKVKHRNNLSLKLIFFDGEEAFRSWGPNDSIYGAKHLAKKWHLTKYPENTRDGTTELDRMDMIILLDLIGVPDPVFYNYFRATAKWYNQLVKIESRLSKLGLLKRYSNGRSEQQYFRPKSKFANIEDDHIPFMQRGVPILHIIPAPFPDVWHTKYDNRDIVDIDTVENLNKIFRVYIGEYLHLPV